MSQLDLEQLEYEGEEHLAEQQPSPGKATLTSRIGKSAKPGSAGDVIDGATQAHLMGGLGVELSRGDGGGGGGGAPGAKKGLGLGYLGNSGIEAGGDLGGDHVEEKPLGRGIEFLSGNAAGNAATNAASGLPTGKLADQQREVKQFDSAGDFYDQRATVDTKLGDTAAIAKLVDTVGAPPTGELLKPFTLEGAVPQGGGTLPVPYPNAGDLKGQQREVVNFDAKAGDDFYDQRATVDVDGKKPSPLDGILAPKTMAPTVAQTASTDLKSQAREVVNFDAKAGGDFYDQRATVDVKQDGNEAPKPPAPVVSGAAVADQAANAAMAGVGEAPTGAESAKSAEETASQTLMQGGATAAHEAINAAVQTGNAAQVPPPTSAADIASVAADVGQIANPATPKPDAMAKGDVPLDMINPDLKKPDGKDAKGAKGDVPLDAINPDLKKPAAKGDVPLDAINPDLKKPAAKGDVPLDAINPDLKKPHKPGDELLDPYDNDPLYDDREFEEFPGDEELKKKGVGGDPDAKAVDPGLDGKVDQAKANPQNSKELLKGVTADATIKKGVIKQGVEVKSGAVNKAGAKGVAGAATKGGKKVQTVAGKGTAAAGKAKGAGAVKKVEKAKSIDELKTRLNKTFEDEKKKLTETLTKQKKELDDKLKAEQKKIDDEVKKQADTLAKELATKKKDIDKQIADKKKAYDKQIADDKKKAEKTCKDEQKKTRDTTKKEVAKIEKQGKTEADKVTQQGHKDAAAARSKGNAKANAATSAANNKAAGIEDANQKAAAQQAGQGQANRARAAANAEAKQIDSAAHAEADKRKALTKQLADETKAKGETAVQDLDAKLQTSLADIAKKAADGLAKMEAEKSKMEADVKAFEDKLKAENAKKNEDAKFNIHKLKLDSETRIKDLEKNGLKQITTKHDDVLVKLEKGNAKDLEALEKETNEAIQMIEGTVKKTEADVNKEIKLAQDKSAFEAKKRVDAIAADGKKQLDELDKKVKDVEAKIASIDAETKAGMKKASDDAKTNLEAQGQKDRDGIVAGADKAVADLAKTSDKYAADKKAEDDAAAKKKQDEENAKKAAADKDKADEQKKKDEEVAAKKKEEEDFTKNTDSAVQDLWKAMDDKWGTDEAAVMKALKGKTPKQLEAIKAAYAKRTGRSLDAALADEMSGADLKEAKAMMSTDPVQQAVAQLQSANESWFSTDRDKIKNTLGEIKDPETRKKVIAEYEKATGVRLEKMLEEEGMAKQGVTTGEFARPVEEPTGPQRELTEEEKQKGFAAVSELEGAMHRWGTDEAKLFAALKGKSPEELKFIKDAYKKKHGKDLDTILEDELSGTDLKEARALMTADPVQAAVAQLHNASDGLGTDKDKVLATLKDIKDPEVRKKVAAEYEKQTGDNLNAMIKDEMSGMDGDLATALIGGPDGKVNQGEVAAIEADKAMHGGFLTDISDSVADATGADRKTMRSITGGVVAVVVLGPMAGPFLAAGGGAMIGTDIGGTDEEALYKALESCESAEDRAELKRQYELRNPGRTLDADLKGELTGKEKDVTDALLAGDKTAAEAAKMAAAADGVGTDRKALYASLEGKSKEDREKIIAKFNEKYGKDWPKKVDPKTGKEMSPFETMCDDELDDLDKKKATQIAEAGKMDDGFALYYGMNEGFMGIGTDDAALKEKLKGKSKEEILAMQKAYLKAKCEAEGKPVPDLEKMTADDPALKALNNDIAGETSGRTGHELTQSLKGNPTTPEEMLQRAKEDYNFERHDSGWMGEVGMAVLMGPIGYAQAKAMGVSPADMSNGLTDMWSDSGKQLDKDYAELVRQYAESKKKQEALAAADPKFAAMKPEDRQKAIDKAVMDELKGSGASAYVEGSIKQFGEAKDATADMAGTVVAIAVGAIITIASGGTAAPALVALISGLAGVSAKMIIKGASMSNEELVQELAQVAAEALAAGFVNLKSINGAIEKLAGKFGEGLAAKIIKEALEEAIESGTEELILALLDENLYKGDLADFAKGVGGRVGKAALTGAGAAVVSTGFGDLMPGMKTLAGKGIHGKAVSGAINQAVGAAFTTAIDPNTYNGSGADVALAFGKSMGSAAMRGLQDGYGSGEGFKSGEGWKSGPTTKTSTHSNSNTNASASTQTTGTQTSTNGDTAIDVKTEVAVDKGPDSVKVDAKADTTIKGPDGTTKASDSTSKTIPLDNKSDPATKVDPSQVDPNGKTQPIDADTLADKDPNSKGVTADGKVGTDPTSQIAVDTSAKTQGDVDAAKKAQAGNDIKALDAAVKALPGTAGLDVVADNMQGPLAPNQITASDAKKLIVMLDAALKSEVGKDAIKALQDLGITLTMQAGKGSFRQGNLINIDPTMASNPNELAGILAHEAHHAKTFDQSVDINTGRDTYIEATLRNEAEAQAALFEHYQQTGSIDGAKNQFGAKQFFAAYAAEAEAFKKANPNATDAQVHAAAKAAGTNALAAVFGSAVPSTSVDKQGKLIPGKPKNYAELYGDFHDAHSPTGKNAKAGQQVDANQAAPQVTPVENEQRPTDRESLRAFINEKFGHIVNKYIGADHTSSAEFDTLIGELKAMEPGALGKPENKAEAKAIMDRWMSIAAQIEAKTGKSESDLRELYNIIEKQQMPVWIGQMQGMSTKDQAEFISKMREELKLYIRDLMTDDKSKEVLYLRDLAIYGDRRGPQMDKLLADALKKTGGDLEAAYKLIVDSAMRSNKDVNKGLTGDESGIKKTDDKKGPISPAPATDQNNDADPATQQDPGGRGTFLSNDARVKAEQDAFLKGPSEQGLLDLVKARQAAGIKGGEAGSPEHMLARWGTSAANAAGKSFGSWVGSYRGAMKAQLNGAKAEDKLAAELEAQGIKDAERNPQIKVNGTEDANGTKTKREVDFLIEVPGQAPVMIQLKSGAGENAGPTPRVNSAGQESHSNPQALALDQQMLAPEDGGTPQASKIVWVFEGMPTAPLIILASKSAGETPGLQICIVGTKAEIEAKLERQLKMDLRRRHPNIGDAKLAQRVAEAKAAIMKNITPVADTAAAIAEVKKGLTSTTPVSPSPANDNNTDSDQQNDQQNDQANDQATDTDKKTVPATGLQSSNDLDTLYKQAAEADPILRGITNDIAQATGGEPMFPPGLKGKPRALEKIAGEYGGDVSKIVDLSRASIVYENFAQLQAGLAALEAQGVEIVRNKDRFAKPTASGYRDITLNVKINGHVCELQLHLKQIMEVKQGKGHELYEKSRAIEAKAQIEKRDLSPEEAAQIKTIEAEAKALYDAAFGSAMGKGKTDVDTDTKIDGDSQSTHDDHGITAAAIPGSKFKGKTTSTPNPNNASDARGHLTALAAQFGLTPVGQTTDKDGKITFKFTDKDNNPVTIRVEAMPLEGDEVAFSVVNPTKDAHVIQISTFADPKQLERAVAHELAEIQAIRDRNANDQPTRVENDALTKGTPLPGAELSPHDMGRLAELGILTKQLAKAQADGDVALEAELRGEVQALVEFLGLRTGTPGAKARLGLVLAQGNLSAEAKALLASASKKIGSLDAADKQGLIDSRKQAKKDADALAKQENYERPMMGPVQRPTDGRSEKDLAKDAADARQKKSDAVVAKLRAEAAKLTPPDKLKVKNPQIGGGAAIAALSAGQLFIDLRGRWQADASGKIAQTAHQLGDIKDAGIGDPSQFVDKPSDRVGLDAINFMQDTLAAQADCVNGKAELKLEADGRMILTITPMGADGKFGAVIEVEIEGAPVFASGFAPENIPRGDQSMGANRTALETALGKLTSPEATAALVGLKKSSTQDDKAFAALLDNPALAAELAVLAATDAKLKAAIDAVAATKAFLKAKGDHPDRVMLGQDANLTKMLEDMPKFLAVKHWVIAGTGGTGISAAEIILRNNPGAKVTMVGRSITPGLADNDQFKRVMKDHGPGGDGRFEVVTGQDVDTIKDGAAPDSFGAGGQVKAEAAVDASTDPNSIDPLSKNSWLVDAGNPKALEAVEKILNGNKDAKVTIVGTPTGADAKAKLATLFTKHGATGRKKLELVTTAGTITTNPDGSATTTGGVEGDGFIGSVGFRGNCSPLVQSLLDQAAQNGWDKTGRLLFDKDGQYIGYQVTIKTPGGDRTVDVTGAASRALPDFLANLPDPDTGRKNADLLREASDRDAPGESGGFDGGYSSSASQAARYARDKRAKQEAQNAADTTAADKFTLHGTAKSIDLPASNEDSWPGTVTDFLAGELGVDPSKITVKRLGGGASGAAVFKVKLGDVDLGVFKVFSSVDDAKTEIAMIQRMAAAGTTKFKVVGDKTDGDLGVSGGAGPRGSMLMESATGRSVSRQIENIPSDPAERGKALQQMADDAKVIAEALAEFHTAMASGKLMTPEAKEKAAKYIIDRKIDPNMAGFGADADQIKAAMLVLIEQFKKAPIPATAYHGDANAGNFMVDGDVVNVIDVGTMKWSLKDGKADGEGVDTGAADLARFEQSLETLSPGKLTSAEAAMIKAAFERAYFDAMASQGVTPVILEAAKKMYAVEVEIAAMKAGKFTPAETAARIRAILGI